MTLHDGNRQASKLLFERGACNVKKVSDYSILFHVDLFHLIMLLRWGQIEDKEENYITTVEGSIPAVQLQMAHPGFEASTRQDQQS